tara:strand:- start:558 stop:1229 length:672 start_codon:yes stop_codon:yes gene_type:complete
MKVRYHAAARELAGVSEEEVTSAEPLNTPALRELLGARHPALRPHLARMRFARNGDFAAADALFGAADEVDVLPPVAGGSPVVLVDIRSEPLSIDEVYAAVDHASAGGVALFVGVVRDHAEGRGVDGLEYEAHPTLALTEARRVLEGVAAEVPEARLAAIHRVGPLRVGERAVVVAASAPHRAEAFRACRLVIDRFKETVPIWKKEHFAAGDARWVNLEEDPE